MALSVCVWIMCGAHGMVSIREFVHFVTIGTFFLLFYRYWSICRPSIYAATMNLNETLSFHLFEHNHNTCTMMQLCRRALHIVSKVSGARKNLEQILEWIRKLLCIFVCHCVYTILKVVLEYFVCEPTEFTFYLIFIDNGMNTLRTESAYYYTNKDRYRIIDALHAKVMPHLCFGDGFRIYSHNLNYIRIWNRILLLLIQTSQSEIILQWAWNVNFHMREKI